MSTKNIKPDFFTYHQLGLPHLLLANILFRLFATLQIVDLRMLLQVTAIITLANILSLLYLSITPDISE